MAAVPVKVPQVSESVSEGVLSRWLKADGATVKADEPLYELDTDKASQVFTAPSSGRLKIGVAEGETVEVHAVIGSIDPDGAAEAAAAPSPAQPRRSDRAASPAPAAGRTATAPRPTRRSPRRSAGSSPRRAPTRARSRGPVATGGSPRGTSWPTWSRPRRQGRPPHAPGRSGARPRGSRRRPGPAAPASRASG